MGEQWLGQRCINRAELGLQQLQTAARLDPRSGWRHVIVQGIGACLVTLDRVEEAIAPMAEAVELAPEMGSPWWWLAAALGFAHRVDDALAVLQPARGYQIEAALCSFGAPMQARS